MKDYVGSEEPDKQIQANMHHLGKLVQSKAQKKNNCSRKVASQETFLLWLSVYFAFFVVVSFKSNNILGNSCDYTRYQERWRTEDPINRSDDREGRHGGEKVLGLR